MTMFCLPHACALLVFGIHRFIGATLIEHRTGTSFLKLNLLTDRGVSEEKEPMKLIVLLFLHVKSKRFQFTILNLSG